MRLRFAVVSMVIASSAAMAQEKAAEQPYLDNRSDAATLVQSLYNAVSRKEYARAWDYFGDLKPSKSYDDFVRGYEQTERVAVLTGAIGSEGAAGSTYYQVPVAIQAFSTDGTDAVFAGCFTARLANPQAQEGPFKPLQLEKGSLKPADGALEDVLPASCGDGPQPPTVDKDRAKVDAMFRAGYSDMCQTLGSDAEPGAAEPTITDIKFRYTNDAESDPERVFRLFAFGCITGAYNTGEVYYLANDYGEVSQIQFAEPDLDIRYKDPDGQTQLESMTIVGYETTDQLVNSFYDENEKSLTSFNKWRGIGDMSSTAKYIFRNGQFVLVHYEVDPTGDGEINGESVLDFDTGP